jgi:hypothetical protein
VHFAEFPDPVIVAFMERVKALSTADRGLLQIRLGDVPPHSFRGAIWHLVKWIRATVLATRVFRLYLWGCQDVTARRAYQRFVSELILDGWTYNGVGVVAVGLMTLRTRLGQPRKAIAYDRIFGSLVGRGAIGWHDDVPGSTSSLDRPGPQLDEELRVPHDARGHEVREHPSRQQRLHPPDRRCR